MELKLILEKAMEWAREAGDFQIEKLEDNIKFSTKSTGIDMVTEIDIASEKMIIDRIVENLPEHSILSEEKGLIDNGSEYTWVIDPLDGTTNYLHGYPIFAVSMGLKRGNETVLGIVYIPRLKEMFHAIKGSGAFLNGKSIHVSNAQEFSSSVFVTGFPYDKALSKDNNIDIFCGIIKDIQGIRRSGSAAFDLCSVACGRIDGYWELKLSPWDMAGGELIVREAGGCVITSETTKHNGDLGINIIAGNKNIVEKMLQRIESIGGYYKKR